MVNNAPEALDTLKELADAIQENGVADLVTKGQLEAALDNKVNKAELNNYVQKSSTAGLLKNDGTVDTNTYLTQHQDLSNYALASDLQTLVARVEALENSSQS